MELGFVLREKSSQDKRAYLLSLTDKGQDAFKTSRALFSQWDEKILKDISEEDQKHLIRIMNKFPQKEGKFKNV